MQDYKPKLTEAELKRQVEDFLQYGMNQGRWYFDRLNSGSLLTKRGESTYRVNLCREGTADFIVLRLAQYVDGAVMFTFRNGIFTPVCKIIFLELKGDKGKQRPEQGAFQKLVEAQGAEYHIIRSVEEVMEILGREL